MAFKEFWDKHKCDLAKLEVEANRVFKSEPFLQILLQCLRECNEFNVPNCLALTEDTYSEFCKYPALRNIVPYKAIGIYHQHEDTYTHATSTYAAPEIKECGYLVQPARKEWTTLEYGIYTFPADCGRVFPRYGNGFVFEFTSGEPHVHIMDCFDNYCSIGEAIFLCEKLELHNLRVFMYKEAVNRCVERFKWEDVAWKYYGVEVSEYDNVNTESILSVLKAIVARRNKGEWRN